MTIDELITKCGDRFYKLKKRGKDIVVWTAQAHATNRRDPDIKCKAKTALEAMELLYKELNKDLL